MALNSLTAKAYFRLFWEAQVTQDGANVAQNLDQNNSIELTAGTGANQADQVWFDERTLTASASEDLEVQDGTVTNQFGQTLTLSKIKLLYVRNKSTAGSILVGGASTAVSSFFGDASDAVQVRQGGYLLLGCADNTAYAVAAGGAIKVLNQDSSNSTTYQIGLVGVD